MKASTRFKVAIVAPYPYPHMVQEGWMSRIWSIDNLFKGTQRIYLNFSKEHDDSQCKEIRKDLECAEILLNPRGKNSVDFVSKIMETVGTIYVHTLHLAEHVLPWLEIGKIYVDIHGITPEEEENMGNFHLKKRYENTERLVLKNANCCICVSGSMMDHYADKYPTIEPRWLTIPINIEIPSDFSISDRTFSDGRRPLVLYSGGTQNWQNVKSMLALAESVGEKFEFNFLSHDQSSIQKWIKESRMTYPPALGYYEKPRLFGIYRSADFGLILRDDSPINRVSCPTKLIEYLLFGLIPVVRSPYIGDFHRFGFAYITEDEFKDGFVPDAASRNWMVEQNYHVVAQLAEQFHAGAHELRTMMQAKPGRSAATIGDTNESFSGTKDFRRSVLNRYANFP